MIDGDALSEKMERLAKFDWNKSTSTTWANAYIEISCMVDDAPTVEPRKGKWEVLQPVDKYNYILLMCSECGTVYDISKHSKYDFCPNCGARMSEGEENEKA